MISTVLAFALAAAAPGQGAADTVAKTRKAYSACLSGFMKKSLKAGTEEAAFKAGLGPACTAQEQAFRAAVISADTASGIKRAAAEEGAGLEVEDLLLNASESYEGYKATNTSPAG